ncbi:GIY-YIG nuclease family protein [Pokkaliibacter plantistimulans]|nr:GIY-YIG nuclease family protein [Pokkaliibacter plantistimulans]
MSTEAAVMWWVYIIEAADGSLYTGITNHLLRRWLAHCQGKGAKYLRSRPPKCLVYVELQPDRSMASKREAAIKRLTRQQKLALIQSDLTR